MEIKDWLGENNSLGIDIWNNKYRYENETFDEWLDRVSGQNKDVKELIQQKKFLFGGRILANRGLEKKGRKITFSNCYVIAPPEDNIESIYETASKLARTYSYGGGCGIDISKLAPRGAVVNNAAKTTSGAVSFMDTYSQVTEQIGQNGRRGALMISLDCNHPDLEEFIDIKKDLNKVTKANISVRFTNDFLRAVDENKPYTLSFTRKETGEVIEKTINAREVFMKLAENNWEMAEPGCLFWDRITDYNLLANTPEFEYAGTNPCAEEPLPAGGSCLLGSINLSAFVKDNRFDFDDFKYTVSIAIEALNDVLDEGLPLHPLKEQRESVRDWRQIGLGIMGLADMLIKLGIKYGSKESLELCDKIGLTMTETALVTSCALAGHSEPFNKCNMEEISGTAFFADHLKDYALYHFIRETGLRNSQLLTIAPTGTLSTMLGISGGIEPIFANSYTRKTESLHNEDVYYKVYTPIVERYMKEHGLTEEEQLPDYFVTAGTLNYKDRIAMQATWQKHIDASISSTINVPEDFTVEEVYDLYMTAWKQGLKGVTIFRDNCLRAGILTTGSKKKEEEPKEEIMDGLKRGDIIETDDGLIGVKRKLMTGCGSLHCEAFFDPKTGEFREIFLSKGSTGGCASFMNGLSRMISLAARGGIKVEDICDQLTSVVTCPSYAVRKATKNDTSPGSCCPNAIAKAIIDMNNQIQSEYGFKGAAEPTSAEKPAVKPQIVRKDEKTEQEYIDKGLCPKCKQPLERSGGCMTCKTCGFSKCD